MRTFLILAFLFSVSAASPIHVEEFSEDREYDEEYYDYGGQWRPDYDLGGALS